MMRIFVRASEKRKEKNETLWGLTQALLSLGKQSFLCNFGYRHFSNDDDDYDDYTNDINSDDYYFPIRALLNERHCFIH